LTLIGRISQCIRQGAYHFQLSFLTSIGTFTIETLMQPAAPTVENTASPSAHATLSTQTSTWPWTSSDRIG